MTDRGQEMAEIDENVTLQTFGLNTDAQTVMTDIITEKFPTLESEYSISAQIIEKFYDYTFPFMYTTDGGGARRWSNAVRAWCGRNAKMVVLESAFADMSADTNFTENISDTNESTITDNSARKTRTTFSGISDTSTERTADVVYSEPVVGENTTKNDGTSSRTRIWSSGKSLAECIAEIENVIDPVYSFINGFERLLIPPCPASQRDVIIQYPPTMSATATVTETIRQTNFSVTVTNDGTQFNPIWNFNFFVPIAISEYYVHHIFFSCVYAGGAKSLRTMITFFETGYGGKPVSTYDELLTLLRSYESYNVKYTTCNGIASWFDDTDSYSATVLSIYGDPVSTTMSAYCVYEETLYGSVRPLIIELPVDTDYAYEITDLVDTVPLRIIG